MEKKYTLKLTAKEMDIVELVLEEADMRDRGIEVPERDIEIGKNEIYDLYIDIVEIRRGFITSKP